MAKSHIIPNITSQPYIFQTSHLLSDNVKTRHSPRVLDLESLRSIASSVHMLTCEVLQLMLLFDPTSKVWCFHYFSLYRSLIS